MNHRTWIVGTISFLMSALTRVDAYGVENVPKTGGIIFATNHASRLDIPLILTQGGRSDVIALVADKYKSYVGFGWLIQSTGCIWIDRSKADFAAMTAALNYIRKGGALGIAPEGTRSSDGKLIEGKSGTALLAERARVPIVPVGIAETSTAMATLRRFRRPHMSISFGKPFTLPPMDRDRRDEWMNESTEEIMCRIAALLPVEQRGFYTDHPRVKELEQSASAA
ncbi:MAG TPA: lysophospholipid acyltransferase family protein [Anaerolineaceae bacterium]|nr:lysophospholipid acyltransferase family protein [Anaerolineaceae bacterium]HPN54035.1 lysophospholipid acyltransferase family protein [Anaerolineaceae bacterium]